MSNGKSRKKGWRGEYEFRKMCEEAGMKVVWHAEDPNLPDLSINGGSCEVKFGSHVPKKFYKWLKDKNASLLAVRRVSSKERKLPWLLIIRAKDFIKK